MKSAFLMHPLDVSYIRRSNHMLADIWSRFFPDFAIEILTKRINPFVQNRFNIGSHESMIVIIPLTANQLNTLPKNFVIEKLTQACDLAYKNGAEIISLGAYTAIASRQGLDLVGKTKIALTTGRAYTVYSVLEQTKPYLKPNSKIAVVGVDGAIGKTIARLSKYYKDIIIIPIRKNNNHEIYEADIIISASSSIGSIIDEKNLKKNSIIIDAAKPSDISRAITRKDIKIIDGGVIKIPSSTDFGIDFDLVKDQVYACMAEAFILGMAGHKENFCVGYDISDEKIQKIGELGEKFGFEVV
jgi:fatty aldehyde-generating acyl-ACP reductase